MEVATTTTEAHLSAIHQSLLQISATLGRMLTYGCVNATSSPDAVVPAKCSTVGLNPNIGAVEVVDSSQQSGIVSTVNPGLVGAPPSLTMQRFGILKSGKHTPTTCSTGVLDVDTDAKNAKPDAGTLQAGLSVHVPWDPGVNNQQIMCTHQELEREIDKSTRLDHVIAGLELVSMAKSSEESNLHQYLSKEMQPHGTARDTQVFPWDPVIKEALMNGLFGLQLHAETCSSQCNFCGISISRKDAKAMQLATDYLLDKMPGWGRGGFSPGHNEQPNVGILPSWQHGGFSSDHGLLVLVSMNGTWVFYSPVWTKGSHGDFSVTVNNALFSVTSNREVNPCSLHIILAKFEKCSVEQLAFCKCLLNVAKAAMRILLTLALKDASCVIRKLLRLLVSFMDMTQNLYLGNSIPSFGVNFHYAVRLPGYFMLRYRCSIFDLWKCTSNHIVQVKKGNAAVPQVLIKCKGVPATSATWEDLHVCRARFPAAVAWGQASFPGGKDVTAGAVHEEEKKY